jgi:Methyltransferase domain
MVELIQRAKIESPNAAPSGAVDYTRHGQGYPQQRRADPRIGAYILNALGHAQIVLNVGAGTGSYEPEGRYVVPIEPSAAMRAQRPAHLARAINGVAERLPLDDQSMDAAMAVITVHQWRDLHQGLKELRRVTCGPIVVVTFDGDALDRFWLSRYAPELVAVERRRYPSIETISRELGGHVDVQPIPIPIDCTDGFSEAFYARPEAFLDEEVRRSQSAWSFVASDDHSRIVTTLSQDLQSGKWDEQHGYWRSAPYFEGSMRLIVSRNR